MLIVLMLGALIAAAGSVDQLDLGIVLVAC
jgi:hypothetical protein